MKTKKIEVILLAGLVALGFVLGTNSLKAQDTKLEEPYAPKASGPTQPGWEIRILQGSNIESKTTLRNGRIIKVSAPAYELVPKGEAVVMKEPGFDPMLANAQKETIGALLTAYSESASSLQATLEKTLAQLDASLKETKISAEPKTEPKPEPKPEEKEKTKKKS